MNVFLETKRLMLRRFTMADVDDLFALHSDPDVMRFLTGGKPTPRAEIERELLPRFLAGYEANGGLGVWAAIEKSTGGFLGGFALGPTEGADASDGNLELGWRLHKSAWGNGYATEGARALIGKAFSELGAQRVFAETMAVNVGSRRVMEKSGLKFVRTFHLAWDDPIEGTEHGEVEYALERAEWAAASTERSIDLRPPGPPRERFRTTSTGEVERYASPIPETSTSGAGDVTPKKDPGGMRPPTDEEVALRDACTRFLVGHGPSTAASFLATIDSATKLDRYGDGGVVAELEAEVAGVLGKPAALFLPTGVMAQQATLRVHADRRGRSTFVAHPACHLDVREGRAYQRLHGLSMRPAGELRRGMTVADLEPIAEAPAALLVELPQRDIGGWLPTWQDLEAQVGWARERGAAAHLDGARLWEAAAGYERTPAEVADLFDTVYVSFYKGLGAIGGCCVAGPADVVAEVREWRTRHGGTVFGLWPYAASCLASLRARAPRMAEYHRHAMAIGAALRAVPGAQVVPDPPQTSHLHVHLRRDGKELRQAALRLARDRQIWTFVRWFRADTPGVQIVELPVGDATLSLTAEEICEIFGFLLTDNG